MLNEIPIGFNTLLLAREEKAQNRGEGKSCSMFAVTYKKEASNWIMLKGTFTTAFEFASSFSHPHQFIVQLVFPLLSSVSSTPGKKKSSKGFYGENENFLKTFVIAFICVRMDPLLLNIELSSKSGMEIYETLTFIAFLFYVDTQRDIKI